ncbi:MAG: hypothetical protein M3P06_23095 [Acidobacteriota bacterium]|nr:hypothetical protein [Acidobacteriota bacterium]
MVRASVVIASLVSLSLAAQPLRVSTPQPISSIRSGTPTGTVQFPLIASNGTSFLMSWADDRFVTGSANQAFASGLLTRVDANGVSLDEFPITLPFLPRGLVWTGSEWIAGGQSSMARISAEGQVLNVRKFTDGAFDAYGLAWTGNRLVVVGSAFRHEGPIVSQSFTGVLALTFDSALHPISAHELTDTPGQVVGIAGDGQSAIALWRGVPGLSQGKDVHAASFGRDGLVQQIRALDINEIDAFPEALPIASTGTGYIVLYPRATDTQYQGLWLERDLDKRSIPLNFLLGPGGAFVREGTYLTRYSAEAGQLFATRFTEDGFLSSPPRFVGMLNSSRATLVAAGIEAKTVVGYAGELASGGLKLRAFTPPVFSDAPERTLTGPGALAQDFPDSASSASQSLVAWRERTSAAQWAVYATRLDRDGKVLDPDSLLLAKPCGQSRPAVATDGRDFLVAWFDEQGISTAAVRSDGTFATRHSTEFAEPCGQRLIRLVSNGTDYLLLWLEKRNGANWNLVAQRLRADGTPLDSGTLIVGKLRTLLPEAVTFHAASNGQDYLVAWRGEATRVTSQGVVLDAGRTILLGVGQARTIWWNGKTYVVEMTNVNVSRFIRIGSDGTGGRLPSGPHEDPVPFPLGPGDLTIGVQSASACDHNGCWVSGTSRQSNGQDTLTVLRYADDGTQVTIRRHDVANVVYSSVNDLSAIPAGIVNPGRPALLFLPQRMEQPFSSVHRLMIAPVEPARGRAVRH